MSVVTNLILSTPLYFGEEKKVIAEKINEYFNKFDQKGLVNIDDESLPHGWYGGSKMMQAELWVGAINYLNLDTFLCHLRTIDWEEDKDMVQVIIKEEEDNVFRIIDVFTEQTQTKNEYENM